MTLMLSWEEIIEKHIGEWIELIDYEWEDTELEPKAGVVRFHSKDRNEFDRLIQQDPPSDSALIFVGKVIAPAGTELSSNSRQLINWKVGV